MKSITKIPIFRSKVLNDSVLCLKASEIPALFCVIPEHQEMGKQGDHNDSQSIVNDSLLCVSMTGLNYFLFPLS